MKANRQQLVMNGVAGYAYRTTHADGSPFQADLQRIQRDLADGDEIGRPGTPAIFTYHFPGQETDEVPLMGLWVPIDKRDRAESALRSAQLDIEADSRSYPD